MRLTTAHSASAPTAMIGGEIPLIDVSGYPGRQAGRRRAAAAELRFAFENVGFYYLAGHGVPQCADRHRVRRGGALPRPADRRRSSRSRSTSTRSATCRSPGSAAQCRRAGQEAQPERGLLPAPRAQRRRSRRDRRPPLPRQNQWPTRDLPGFREQTLKLHEHAWKRCARSWCGSMRWRSTCRQTFFDGCFTGPHMILRQSRYPLIDAPTTRSPAWCRTPIPGS